MYIVTKANDRIRQAGLRGFAQPPQGEYQRSLDAILKALQLNPVGGYVKGSSARKQLEETFKSVPGSSALELYDQLLGGKGPLEKLFRHKIAAATQQTMLWILAGKAKEFQQQQEKDKEEAAQKIREVTQKAEEYRERICQDLKDQAQRAKDICQERGEDDPLCAQLQLVARRDFLMFQRENGPCP